MKGRKVGQMSFRYRKPPAHLLEISDRIYVFDCCFSDTVMKENDHGLYTRKVISQLREHHPEASFMVCNFEEEDGGKSIISDIIAEYDMKVLRCSEHRRGCHLPRLELAHEFLRSSETWLSKSDNKNVLLMYCDKTKWPVLAFMLAGLLFFKKHYKSLSTALEAVYSQAPNQLRRVFPLNSEPSHLRYLGYLTKNGNRGAQSPPLNLSSIILKSIPDCTGNGSCRALIRVHGSDPSSSKSNMNSKLLYSTQNPKKFFTRNHRMEDRPTATKMNIGCVVSGDVVLECSHLKDDLVGEVLIFRVTFNTGFIRSNSLKFNREEIDLRWDSDGKIIPMDFKLEVLFSDTGDHPSSELHHGNSDEIREGIDGDKFFETDDFLSSGGSTPSSERNLPKPVQTSKSSPETGKPQTSQHFQKLRDSILSIQEFKHQKQAMISQMKSTEVSLESRRSSTFNRQNSTLFTNRHANNGHSSDDSVQSWSTGVSSTRSGLNKGRQSPLRRTLPSTSKLPGEPARSPSPASFPRKQQDKKGVPAASPQRRRTKASPPTTKTRGRAMKVTPPLDSAGRSLSSSLIPRISLSSNSLSPSVGLTRSGNPSPQHSPVTVKATPSPPSPPPKHLNTAGAPPHPPSPPKLVGSHALPPPPKLEATSTGPRPPPPPPPPPRLEVTSTGQRPSPPPPPPKLEVTSSRPRPPPPPAPSKHEVTSPGPRPSPPPPPPKHEVTSPGPRLPQPPPPPKLEVTSTGPRPPPPPPPPTKLGGANFGSRSPPPIRGRTTAGPPPAPPPPSSKIGAGALVPPPPPGSKLIGGAPPPPPPPRQSKICLQSPTRASRSPQLRASLKGPAPPPAPGRNKQQSPMKSGGAARVSPVLKKSLLKQLHWVKVPRIGKGTLWSDLQTSDAPPSYDPDFDEEELRTLFSTAVADKRTTSRDRRRSLGSKSEVVHLIELRRSNNCEIMLTKVKMPFSDLMLAVLTLDDAILDGDQVDSLRKFCPTREEMEILKGYTGDKNKLGKCEQFFLELMKVPRAKSKLDVFAFKINFTSKLYYMRKNLNIINKACVEIRSSVKLKEIFKKILFIGNHLNKGTAKGSAIGFHIESLLKLTDTRANNATTLMHFLCKITASRSAHLLDFYDDLGNLDAASKIQLKVLGEEMDEITKGLETVKTELNASENDGLGSQGFFRDQNADALVAYFSEDAKRCPFEQVISTLQNFVRMFRRAHEENCKQLEIEKKKSQKFDAHRRVQSSS
ncbi:hypothetical protein ZOSMA_340G00130 [Zostera marina]|uniref:Formin-like protein n=1 Tax=Zostera marina TaxID=29655 RepID=A0A0K9P9M7_ZOSMR|nr:hypothetical protein ZOSMA_340G00130 [Zostera marina]